MATIRLFDEDVWLRRFTARVIDCRPQGDRWLAELDRTAFFPEGGGQLPDRGELEGVPVLDVQEKDGVILHTLSAPLEAGREVTGSVDPTHRLDMMQQHSGEHIFTGLACRAFGCRNVGFHIGPEEMTIDLSLPLAPEDVAHIERAANEVIWRDQPIRAWYPAPEELAQIDYRSKKELTGAVRIVAIDDVDTCACCGTHVSTTGQVGQIRAIDCRSYKGGVRIWLACGARALNEAVARHQECRAISHATNGKWGQLAPTVDRLLAERDALKQRCDQLALALFRQQAAAEPGPARVIVAEPMSAPVLRRASAMAAEGAACALILMPREAGWDLCLCSQTLDVRPLAAALTERFGGRAGGPKEQVRGVLQSGDPAELREALLQLI